MPFILFTLFVVIPILEVAAFIQIGSLIGLLPTLASIVLTAVIGAFLVRRQGFKVINEARAQSARNEIPVTAVIHGVFILAAGLLLLTPGFVTDTIGFVFLVPSLRLLIAGKVWAWIQRNMDVTIVGNSHTATGGPRSHPSRDAEYGDVIDGEAVEVDEPQSKDKPYPGSSPWTPTNHRDG